MGGKLRILATTAIAGVAFAALTAGTASAQDIVGLITKTETNPFFVKMREGAEAKAAEFGLELRSFSGKFDGDNEAQVAAIESLIAAGAKGILITPSSTRAIVPAVQKARDAGILVIALDTLLDPAEAADATFATDNFKAGELGGQWAAATLGDAAADARIAFLDIDARQVTVDVSRDQGFMTGFGIDTVDPNFIGDETDARIVGHGATLGAEEGGRTAMENLLQLDPNTSVVYTINEPAAAGAFEALKAFGLQDQVLVVSIDGGCPGVRNVRDGVIGATSMQFPLLMASKGVEAVANFIKTGEKPVMADGANFINTGVVLITDQPVEGVPSKDTAYGLENCWG